MKFRNESLYLEQLQLKVKERVKGKGSFLVALDADGTLWPQDVNHILLDYQEENSLLKTKDLLSSYKEDDKRIERCKEFARRQAAFSFLEFQSQCQKALKQKPLEVFPFQRKLFSFLKEQGAEIFIITASLKYLVEEALRINNLVVDQVLGVETKIKEGRLTTEILPPVTYGEGKREAFLKKASGKKLLLAGGNSQGDLSFLELAEVSFVVNSANSEHENFPSEQKMKQWAQKENQFLFEI